MSSITSDTSRIHLRRTDVEEQLSNFGSSKRLDLSERNLEGTDLSFLQLSGIILRKANLHKANLRGTNLTAAKLDDVILIEANLNEAILTKAKLTNAQLMGSYLVASDLRDVDLRGANLHNADLRRSNLRRSQLSGANLTNIRFENTDVTGAFIDEFQRDFLRGESLVGLDKVVAGKRPDDKKASDELATFKITLSKRDLESLQAMARRFGISLEYLLQANIREMLIPPDDSFNQEIQYILDKNAELYRRLA